MDKKCYKEASRACNGECAAYVEGLPDVSCLELATQAEVARQLTGYRISQDLGTYYTKVLVDTMGPLGGSIDDLKGMLDDLKGVLLG